MRGPVRVLDPTGRRARWGAAESIALLLWFAVGGYAVAHHVPWADEEQAWFLARESSWSGLFLHALHYEGEGGLWHAFLKLLSSFGVSFAGMHWAALAAEGAAMALLLRFAPFGPLPRLLLPFTFFLLYQDGVVARSYSLFAVLAFGAAALLRAAKPRPVLLACVLGMLAMLSVHGVVLSLGLALAAVWRWRGHASLRVAGAVLLVWWVAVAAVMAPARDIDFPAGNNLHRSLAGVERALGMHPAPAPPRVTTLPMAGLPPPSEPVHIRHGVHSTLYRAARWLGVITFPLSAWRWFALLVAGGVVMQAVLAGTRSGGLGPVGLVPYLLMIAVFSSLYMEPRHAGTLFVAFLVGAWLSWPESPGNARLLLARVAAALLVVMSAEQIGWTARALWAEHGTPYAPGRTTAQFLHAQGVGSAGGPLVAGFYYFSISPLAWFPRNIYFNQPPHRHWQWSISMRSYADVWGVLARHPEFIVVSGATAGPDAEVSRDWRPNPPPLPGVVYGDGFHIADFFRAHGYRQTHVFCGYRWMRWSYDERICDVILQPGGNVSAP